MYSCILKTITPSFMIIQGYSLPKFKLLGLAVNTNMIPLDVTLINDNVEMKVSHQKWSDAHDV